MTHVANDYSAIRKAMMNLGLDGDCGAELRAQQERASSIDRELEPKSIDMSASSGRGIGFRNGLSLAQYRRLLYWAQRGWMQSAGKGRNVSPRVGNPIDKKYCVVYEQAVKAWDYGVKEHKQGHLCPDHLP